jgi:uncharacterized membrane protein YqjE
MRGKAGARIRYAAGMASPKAPEETVSEIVHGLTDEVHQLVADEVNLAKAELKEAGKRGARVVVAAAVGMLGAGVFLVFALVTLVEWLPNHTLVAAMVALVGLALLLVGTAVALANRRLWPFSQTKASLEEDLQWARRQSKRVRR